MLVEQRKGLIHEACEAEYLEKLLACIVCEVDGEGSCVTRDERTNSETRRHSAPPHAWLEGFNTVHEAKLRRSKHP